MWVKGVMYNEFMLKIMFGVAVETFKGHMEVDMICLEVKDDR